MEWKNSKFNGKYFSGQVDVKNHKLINRLLYAHNYAHFASEQYIKYGEVFDKINKGIRYNTELIKELNFWQNRQNTANLELFTIANEIFDNGLKINIDVIDIEDIEPCGLSTEFVCSMPGDGIIRIYIPKIYFAVSKIYLEGFTSKKMFPHIQLILEKAFSKMFQKDYPKVDWGNPDWESNDV